VVVNLLAAERIKLFSTRSPWWTSGLAVVLVVGLTALVAGTWDIGNGPVPFGVAGFFATFGMVVVMVMATVAATSEYRFGTIRTTFQTVPARSAALLAKTAVVALAAGFVGLVAGFGAWGAAWLLGPPGGMAIATAAEWRSVAGTGLVWAIGAVIALAVGILVRQTAGAVAIVLVWVLLVENLIALVPRVGADVQRWVPFVNANHFLTAGVDDAGGGPAASGPGMLFGPWGSLAYFAGIAVALLVLALVVADRRDA
jgi:ABC-2 type transport system permease protein